MAVELFGDDELLRRILFKDPNYYKRDDDRPTSSNFSLRKNEEGLSVDLRKLITLEDAIIDQAKYRLICLFVDEIKLLGFTVENDGIPHPAHCIIKGNFTNKRVTRELARIARKIDFPDLNW